MRTNQIALHISEEAADRGLVFVDCASLRPDIRAKLTRSPNLWRYVCPLHARHENGSATLVAAWLALERRDPLPYPLDFLVTFLVSDHLVGVNNMIS